MVTFRLIYKSEKEIRYEYYPEDDRSCVAGLIGIDIAEETIDVLQPAEKDYRRRIKAMDLIAMRESINEMRKEVGEAPLTEEELPTVQEDCEYYQYASHAMNKISEEYEKGIILEKGTVMWY